MKNIEVIAWMKERLSDNIQSLTIQQIILAADNIKLVEVNLEEFTKWIGDDL